MANPSLYSPLTFLNSSQRYYSILLRLLTITPCSYLYMAIINIHKEKISIIHHVVQFSQPTPPFAADVIAFILLSFNPLLKSQYSLNYSICHLCILLQILYVRIYFDFQVSMRKTNQFTKQ